MITVNESGELLEEVQYIKGLSEGHKKAIQESYLIMINANKTLENLPEKDVEILPGKQVIVSARTPWAKELVGRHAIVVFSNEKYCGVVFLEDAADRELIIDGSSDFGFFRSQDLDVQNTSF